MDDDRQTFEEAVLERICVTCPESGEGGGCHLHALFACGVKEALPALLDPGFETCGASVAAYLERLRTVPPRGPDGPGTMADDEVRTEQLKGYYLALILEAVEDVRSRRDGAVLASAP